MKKHLLLISAIVLSGASAFAQVSNTDAPSIGDIQSLFVVDSAANAYDNVTGTGVTWDYSTLTGYNSLKDTVQVVDAAQTDYDTSFTNSDRSVIINHFFMNYYTNPVATEENKTGFVFINSDTTIPIGDIVVPFDAAVSALSYPMNVGDVVQSNFQGTATVHIYTVPSNPATINPFMKGTLTITLDGKGTLKLASNNYSDVYRFKIEEKADAYVTELSDSAHYKRVQYEYYDFSVSNLPIFIHADAQFLLGTTPLIQVHPVLSLEDPATAGITENKLSSFTLYPNPTKENVTLQLNNPLATISSVAIIDNLGRTVYTDVMQGNEKVIATSNLKNGLYFVRISNGANTVVKKLVVK